jgi:hypothetical protein
MQQACLKGDTIFLVNTNSGNCNMFYATWSTCSIQRFTVESTEASSDLVSVETVQTTVPSVLVVISHRNQADQ